MVVTKQARRIFRAAALAALAMVAHPGMAETKAVPADKLDIMLSFSVEGGLPDPAPYRESLEAALLSESAVGGLIRYEGPASDIDRASKAARASGCRLLLVLRLRASGAGVKAEWSFVDSALGTRTESREFEKEAPGRAVLASSFWTELLVDLEATLALPRPAILLEVKAPPGTLFDGAGPRRVLPASGKLELVFDVPLILAWTASMPGQYPVGGSLEVKAGRTLLGIAPRMLSLGLGAVGLSFPEIEIDADIWRHLALRAGLSQYLFGLALHNLDSNAGSAAPSFSVSLPLLSPYLGVRASPFEPSADFRPYAAADLFARLALLSATRVYFDPVAPVGLNLGLGFDWGIQRHVRLWMETGAYLYPWAEPLAFLASAGINGGGRAIIEGGPLFPGHPGWAGELPVFSAGIRIGL
ncbi:MAG TPA: hypothetical protein VMV44_08945 [Rectinemataceae bacterium]|nr:hypothetical protein [Rectinemataceae bacterium]